MPSQNDLSVKVGADITNFKAGMADLNRQTKLVQSGFKASAAALGDWTKSAEGNRKRAESLSKTIELQKQKVANLTTEYDKVVAAKGENSAAAQNLAIKINKETEELNRNEAELKRVTAELKKQESAVYRLGQKMQVAGEKMKALGGKMSAVGKNMTKFVTVPLLAAGAGLLKLGMNFDEAVDKIRIGTGATGEALKELEADFEAVYATVPSGMGDVSTAIADLNTRLGLTGKPLQALSKQMLNLARLTKVDVSTAVQSATRMFQDAGIAQEDYADALDYTFRVSQQTGIGIDRLQQLMTQFGGPLRQMGFSWQEAAAMLGKFEKEGVNTELVVGSLRIALGKMAKEGIKDPPKALKEITKRIKEAGTAGEANAIALEAFGAKAGPDMAAAIREGRMDFEELLTSLKNGKETINGAADETADFAEKFQLLKNKLALALKPLSGELMKTLEDLIPTVVAVAESIADLLKGFSNLSPETKRMILVAVALAAALGPVIRVVGGLISGIGSLVGGVGKVVSKFGAWIASGSSLSVALGTAGVVGAVVLVGAALVSLIGASDEAKQKVDALLKSVEESSKAYKENEVDIEANAVVASKLSDELITLSEKENKTNAEKIRMKGLVQELNALIPELGLEIDDITGKLNLEAGAIKGVIKQKLAEIKLSAATERLTELYKEQYKIEQERTAATKKFNETQADILDYIFPAMGAHAQLGTTIAETTKALEENIEETEQLEREYAGLVTSTANTAKFVGQSWGKMSGDQRAALLKMINSTAAGGKKLDTTTRTIVNSMMAEFATLPGGLNSIGKDTMVAFGRAIINEKSPKEASTATRDECIRAFKGAYGEFEKAGKGGADAVAIGISGGAPTATEAAGKVKAAITNELAELKTGLEKQGLFGLQGLARGLSNSRALAIIIAVAKAAAMAAKAAMERVVEGRSPSKMTTRLGKQMGQGLAVGMLAEVGNIRKAATGLATAAIPNLAAIKNVPYSMGAGAYGGGVSASTTTTIDNTKKAEHHWHIQTLILKSDGDIKKSQQQLQFLAEM